MAGSNFGRVSAQSCFPFVRRRKTGLDSSFPVWREGRIVRVAHLGKDKSRDLKQRIRMRDAKKENRKGGKREKEREGECGNYLPGHNLKREPTRISQAYMNKNLALPIDYFVMIHIYNVCIFRENYVFLAMFF